MMVLYTVTGAQRLPSLKEGLVCLASGAPDELGAVVEHRKS